MTPAEEIAAAVEKLRTARFAGGVTMTPAVAGLVAAREPLADWLERSSAAAQWSFGLFGDATDPAEFLQPGALAVARAINGSQS